MLKRFICLILFVALILSCSICAYAAESSTNEQLNNTLTVIGEYTDATKDDVIQSILENDPNALIFTSVEEAETYITELQNATVTTSLMSNARSTRKTMHIGMYIGLSRVNVYYDYALNSNGTVYTIYQDTVSSSMTGLSPGVTYQQNRLSVTKKDSMHISSDLFYTLTYYLVVDYIVQLGTEDFRYQFIHDVTTDAVTKKQIV